MLEPNSVWNWGESQHYVSTMLVLYLTKDSTKYYASIVKG
jgi:hypothetical protein